MNWCDYEARIDLLKKLGCLGTLEFVRLLAEDLANLPMTAGERAEVSENVDCFRVMHEDVKAGREAHVPFLASVTQVQKCSLFVSAVGYFAYEVARVCVDVILEHGTSPGDTKKQDNFLANGGECVSCGIAGCVGCMFAGAAVAVWYHYLACDAARRRAGPSVYDGFYELAKVAAEASGDR